MDHQVDIEKLRMDCVAAELESVRNDIYGKLNGFVARLKRIEEIIHTPYGPVIDGMNAPLPVSIKCLNRDVKYAEHFMVLNGIANIDEIIPCLHMGYCNTNEGVFLNISVHPGFLEAHKARLLKSGIVNGYSQNTPPDSICRVDLESRLTLNDLVRYRKNNRQNLQQNTDTEGLR